MKDLLCDSGDLKACVLLCPQLLLFERTWMNRWKSSVLHEGEGNIRSVKWRGHLIAWANNMVKALVCLSSTCTVAADCQMERAGQRLGGVRILIGMGD